jgi:hypothetical protein
MRPSFALSAVLACAYACGSSNDVDFNRPPAPGGLGASAGQGAAAGMNTGASGGTDGSGASAGTAGSGAQSGGTGGSGATPSAGAAGDEGSAGAAGAGGATPETCPGTLSGCVNDWAGSFGTAADVSVDGVGDEAVFGDAGGDSNLVLRAITGDGTYLYVAGNACVRRIAIATAAVDTLAGECGNEGYDNEIGADARFGFIDGIATDGSSVWVSDGDNHVIRRIDLATRAVTYLTGDVGNPGNNDGASSFAEFDAPRGMTYAGGYLYVVEQGNDALRRVDPTSGAVTTVAGDNNEGDLDSTGNNAQFLEPRKVTSDGTDLYVADTDNHLIRRVVIGGIPASSNTVSTLAGSRTGDPNTPGYSDATGELALFNSPRGITFDGQDLILADRDNCVLRKISLPGAVVTTIAGVAAPLDGTPCAHHVVGVGTAAEFNQPMDVHYDAGTGDLFILENSVVRRMYQ